VGRDKATAAVVHDERVYSLNSLLQGLTPKEMRTIEQSAPRSDQEIWDEVVRRWPALADEIAAAVGPAT
jgi:hypothetical protein